uniref:Uncharacterized protein n=1 Tax=Setaria digitata TaxID=48799 RepID=A0A915PVN7_9BILA
MIESLINRRFLLLGTIIILITLIFFLWIYRVENIYDGDFVLKKFVTWNIPRDAITSTPHVTQPVSERSGSKSPDYLCYKHEPVIVLERCVACSRFEQNAVGAGVVLIMLKSTPSEIP